MHQLAVLAVLQHTALLHTFGRVTVHLNVPVAMFSDCTLVYLVSVILLSQNTPCMHMLLLFTSFISSQVQYPVRCWELLSANLW